MRKCPRCGGEGHRSQSRGFIEKHVLKWIHVRPYRCHHCNKRFYRYSRGRYSKHRHFSAAATPLPRLKERDDALPSLVAHIREAEQRLEISDSNSDQLPAEPSQPDREAVPASD